MWMPINFDALDQDAKTKIAISVQTKSTPRKSKDHASTAWGWYYAQTTGAG